MPATRARIVKSAPVLLFALLPLLFLRRILCSEGVVGLSHDWDLPAFSEMWSVYPITSHIVSKRIFLNILFLGLSRIGLQMDALSKVFLYMILFMSLLSAYLLCREMGYKALPSSFGAFLYGCSPPLLFRIAAGHLAYIFSYSISPIAVMFFLRSANRKGKSLFNSLLSGLLLGISFVQVQFAIMILLVVLLLSFLAKQKMNYLKTALLTGFVALIVNASWILWELFAGGPRTLAGLAVSEQYTIQAVRQFSPDVFESFFMQSGGGLTNYYQMLVLSTGFPWYLIFLSWSLSISLLFSGMLLQQSSKASRTRPIVFSSMTLAGIFLSKGANDPVGYSFLFLLSNVPYFVSFRESYKFSFIAVLGYSLLLAHLVDFVISRKSFGRLRLSVSRPALTDGRLRLTLALMIALLVLPPIAVPFVNLGDALQPYKLGDDYRIVYQQFLHDKEQYSILWLPPVQPFKYNDLTMYGTDPLIGYSPKPSAVSQYAANSPQLFLVSSLVQKRDAFLPHTFLDFMNVKKIVQRDDFVSMFPYYVYMTRYSGIFDQWKNEVMFEVLKSQRGLEITQEMDKFRIFTNVVLGPKVYVAHDLAMLTGGYDSVTTLSYAAPVWDRHDGIMFALQTTAEAQTANTVIVNGNTLIDLLSRFAPDAVAIDPGEFPITLNDAELGWVKASDWWWYDWRIVAQFGKGALTLSRGQLDVPFEVPESNTYVIAIKTLCLAHQPSLQVTIDNTPYEDLGERVGGFGYRLVRGVHLQKGVHKVGIRAGTGGEYYVGPIFVLREESFNAARRVTRDYLAGRNVVLLQELEEFSPVEGDELPLLDIELSQGEAFAARRFQSRSWQVEIPIEGKYRMFIRASSGLEFERTGLKIEVKGQASNNMAWYDVGESVFSEGMISPMFSFDTDAQLDILALICERPSATFSKFDANNRLKSDVSENVITCFYEFDNPSTVIIKGGMPDGWHLSRGGENLEVFMIDIGSLAIRVPPGIGRLELTRDSPPIGIVLASPIATLLLCVLVVAVYVTHSRQYKIGVRLSRVDLTKRHSCVPLV